ncbi:Uncharacterised protein [Candidatus Bartonella washoeensis]|uniref:Uncharacterized protein n=2 Tax=Candidatus Bartonella washoeensis TaxID=186739 RepID=J0QK32_9HYPH|nr:hypothetical protein MCQ_01187 [Bartonella washoeensis Sb944nv]EJF83314.1 hypothetical protein MCW_01383 [Bartonella washoeensis 085-0475]SPU27290.1 Uncharacterised protein [Bartonella washoeensis]
MLKEIFKNFGDHNTDTVIDFVLGNFNGGGGQCSCIIS